ncbi:family 16 glycosylhydrolase [Phenylobacterium sp.]|uniref:family 16 glycosylhydrolase n=1 Tax=Phenylobacterium sp. TaxID=1871053 RepID=UPI002DF0B2FE|nr:family 16 glycosylhydrolase [Phenylobacterium sp.]
MTYFNYLGQAMAESASGPGVFGTSAGGETLTAPAGPSLVDGNGGGDLLIGSNGDNTFEVRDPNDIVQVAAGSPGVKTVTAFLSYTLPANVQNLTSSGALNYAAGNSLDNLIKVGNDGETLYGGGGNDVLVGGFGNDTFIVKAGEGNDVIYGFHAGDAIRLISPALPNFQAVQSAMTQVGSDVSIKISGSEQLVIRNATVSQFGAQNFLLALDRSQLGAATLDDEFNSFQPYNFQTHTGLWRTDFGLGRDNVNTYRLTQNGEQQDYVTADFQGTSGHALGYNPFSDAGGVLTITAQPFSQTDSQQSFGASYASGMINTKGIFEQQYGYFEMRAQLPTAAGAWPAFWMVPDPNTNGVEADIGENIAIKPNLDFVRAYAGSSTAFGNVLKLGDPSGFHTYGMLWTPQTVTFFYDDQAVYQTATPASWNQPMYLIANLAVGGFGGNPNGAQFPASMQIDYIHAYALPDGSSVVHNLTPATQDPPPTGTAGSTPGDDQLQAGPGNNSIDGGAGNDTITGWSGGDQLRGNDGNDSIMGGSGFDDINGNKGDDTIDGGSGGADWLVGGQGNDLITAHAGQNILYGNLGNDTLHGGSGGDLLRGGQGDDVIVGGSGNDWISGDRGDDTLTGGAGADIFHTFNGAGLDVVTDFHSAEGDRVQVDPGTSYTLSQSGADVIIDLGGGDEMILRNVQLSALPPGWIFGA